MSHLPIFNVTPQMIYQHRIMQMANNLKRQEATTDFNFDHLKLETRLTAAGFNFDGSCCFLLLLLLSKLTRPKQQKLHKNHDQGNRWKNSHFDSHINVNFCTVNMAIIIRAPVKSQIFKMLQ